MPAAANPTAERPAKEEGNSNTSSNNPSLAAGSSALGEAGGGHAVAAPGVRLTDDEVRQVRGLVREGMKPELACGAVLAKRDPRRRGFSDLSLEKTHE
jgi:hypothetical protein